MGYNRAVKTRKSSHAVYRLEYHVVWIPRYRRKILVHGVKEYLEKYLLTMEELDDDIEVIQVNVQVDHVHLVLCIPPRIAIADVMRFIKSRSGKRLRERFGYILKTIKKAGIWSRGYFVSSVGINEKVIRDYVRHQERDDTGKIQLELDL